MCNVCPYVCVFNRVLYLLIFLYMFRIQSLLCGTADRVDATPNLFNINHLKWRYDTQFIFCTLIFISRISLCNRPHGVDLDPCISWKRIKNLSIFLSSNPSIAIIWLVFHYNFLVLSEVSRGHTERCHLRSYIPYLEMLLGSPTDINVYCVEGNKSTVLYIHKYSHKNFTI